MNTARFSQFMSVRSLHVLPAVLLRDRWVRCDPTDDARIADQVGHINPPSQRVDFDGHGDAMLNLPVQSIEYYDATCWPTVDAILARAPRISPVVVGVLNRYLDFGREFGREYQSASSISDSFWKWLRAAHPEEYRAYEELEALLASRASESARSLIGAAGGER